jgi:hypothetical protein
VVVVVVAIGVLVVVVLVGGTVEVVVGAVLASHSRSDILVIEVLVRVFGEVAATGVSATTQGSGRNSHF